MIVLSLRKECDACHIKPTRSLHFWTDTGYLQRSPRGCAHLLPLRLDSSIVRLGFALSSRVRFSLMCSQCNVLTTHMECASESPRSDLGSPDSSKANAHSAVQFTDPHSSTEGRHASEGWEQKGSDVASLMTLEIEYGVLLLELFSPPTRW